MAGGQEWVYPFGSAARGRWSVDIDSRIPGWQHAGLKVAELSVGEAIRIELTGCEAVVVPLHGSFGVEADGLRFELAGRPSVFAGPTDVVYLPAGSSVTLTGAGRVAVGTAQVGGPATRPARYLPATAVPVELRGAGHCSREVRNFGTPEVLDADKIIACEVITPAGNVSSYPPHKHDEQRPGSESELAEIYYFSVQAPGAPSGADPHGYQRVYGTKERPIEVLTQVRDGDVVLVPHGWHGPAVALPGYDLYYLNVMAGPGPERAWLICDDPAHGWVRESWAGQQIDPRLPMGRAR